jgi:acetylornithine deacetylase/succinyl-diaminopimelate desuccinylase-like protein
MSVRLLTSSALALLGTFSVALAVLNERRMQKHRQPGITYADVTFRKDGAWKRTDLFTHEGLAYQRKAARFGFIAVTSWLAALALLMIAAAPVTPAKAQQATTGAQARAAARTYREAREPQLLSDFAKLLAMPNVAVNLADVRANAAYLVAQLRTRGLNPQLLEVDAAPPAVYAELKAPGATRTVVFYAHYDGQPVVASEWRGAPFTPVLRDKPLTQGGRDIPFPAAGQRANGESRIYARSAGDDKATIIAMLTAIDAMKASSIAPSVNIKFFFEGEEEAGSPHLAAILTKYKDLLRADAWVFGDGPMSQDGAQTVVFGQRGVIGLQLTVFGPTRPLHSGHYGNWAPNPGALIANLIASMRDDDGRIKIANYYDDVAPISAAEHRAIAAMPAVDSMLRASLGLAGTEARGALLAERIMLPALNVRGIRVGGVGESSTNVISTEAFASFDLRMVPNQKPERVKTLVTRHIEAQGYHVVTATPDSATRARYPKIVKLEWEGGYPAQRTALDNLFGRAFAAAVNDGAAKPAILMPTSGGSGPSYLFTEILGAPVISLPIANYDNNQHAANENLRVQNLWDGIELYTALFVRLGKTWPGGAQ